MNEIIALDDGILDDEELDVGSVNHSLTQAKLTHLLSSNETFTVMVELSLDTSQIDLSRFNLKAKNELVPDVCVYTGQPPEPDEDVDDLLTVSQMPDLAIEIISPSQSISFLVRKIKAYFALGVKSCWLVVPPMAQVSVYQQPNQHKTFDLNHTEVIDEVLDIRLPIHKVFKKRSINIQKVS